MLHLVTSFNSIFGFDLEPDAVDNGGLGYIEMIKVFIKTAVINMKVLYLHNYH
jgi:hypothetical protein